MVNQHVNKSFGKYFPEPNGFPVTGLADALTAGGIFYRITGSDKESALRAVVENMRLPDAADRSLLCSFSWPEKMWPQRESAMELPFPMSATLWCSMCNQPMITLCFSGKAYRFLSLADSPYFAFLQLPLLLCELIFIYSPGWHLLYVILLLKMPLSTRDVR